MRPVIRLLRASWLAVPLLGLAAVAAAADIPCPDPPIYPPTRAFIQPPRPCPDQDVRIVFSTCAPCFDIVSATQGPDGITVQTVQTQPNCITATVCLPESTSLPLGRFAAGHHSLVVRFLTTFVRSDSATGDTVHCEYTNFERIEFDVAPTCNQNSLPYVKEIVIGGPAPCATCPPQICPNDSIPVVVRGEFPNDCINLVGVDLVPAVDVGPFPVPPTLRITYWNNDCVEQQCPPAVETWERKVMLPPLPSLQNHVYWLQAVTSLRTYHCDIPPDSIITGEAQFPFAVAESCSTHVEHCFLSSFQISPTGANRCDDFVGSAPGHAVFKIGSSVPLYGLEGRFVFNAPGMAVTGIEAIGEAVGMKLVWQPTADGAKFVLFSQGDAHIPPAPPLQSSSHQPILRVTVELTPVNMRDPAPPDHVTMRVTGLLGATQSGEGVEVCPVRFFAEPFDSYFIFCTGGTCDFNRDGSTDVRDLVRMVGCLNDSAHCDLTGADCNGDGHFDLEDVFCCAHVLLGGGQPDTTGGRPDPSLRLTFGAPTEHAGALEIPVALDGASPVGGARVVLTYPSDRFDVAEVDFPGRSTWLEMKEITSGRVVVGMLDLGGVPSSAFHHQFTLRLVARAGQRPGGMVAVEAAEFSDPHGVALVADLGSPRLMLGGGRLALGFGRPNPFAEDVRFAVTLAEPSNLEVSIHDLTGRLVTTLHRGQATAGEHTFHWDGRDDGGARVPPGVYFYTARAAGETLARKVVLLRE